MTNDEQDPESSGEWRPETAGAAYLWIRSATMTAAEVSAAIGVQPDRVERVGDRIRPTRERVHRRHAWIAMEPREGDAPDAAACVRLLLDRLDHATPSIAALDRERVTVGVSVWIVSAENVELRLREADVHRISALRATLFVDVYF